ncbi:hypothetical protein EB241_15805 [Erwinia psidii]|uniref:Uncharacterized protein n=1 Tax=Erwinia psidii TaxID=69224 RepID=A0A3N6RWI2_9GAMM|nr:hypothetical protein EB241_15805 [Erwinia psidii]
MVFAGRFAALLLAHITLVMYAVLPLIVMLADRPGMPLWPVRCHRVAFAATACQPQKAIFDRPGGSIITVWDPAERQPGKEPPLRWLHKVKR